MKIDSGIKSVGTPSGGATQRAPAASATQSATPAGVQVDLSPAATRLKEAEAAIEATAVVDAGRVAEIKQAIAEGRFKVNPERIADGLLDSVREMLSQRRQQG